MVADEPAIVISVFVEYSGHSTKGLKYTNAHTIAKCLKEVIKQLLHAFFWYLVELKVKVMNIKVLQILLS